MSTNGFILAVCMTGTAVLGGCSYSLDFNQTPQVTVDPEFENSGANPIDLPLGSAGICTTEGINAWVDAQMRDYYIYSDQVPVVELDSYDTPSAVLNDLRVLPDEYSSISEQVTRDALFDEGQTFGFGFRWRRDQEGALRFSNIVAGSPLDNAGAQRGDRVLALNGVPELDITDNVLKIILGESGEPTPTTFTTVRGNEPLQDIVVTSGLYTITTVPNVRVFADNERRIGYIESTTFLRTSEAELDEAIGEMNRENVTEIILDFRYNGGGFVYIAQKLAAQLINSSYAGRAFQSTEFNNRYAQFNRTDFLEPQEINLNLARVVILTTRSTASASEAIANNLRPYVDVVLIGTDTRGKPFASVSNPNCELALNAMDRINRNDNGDTVLGGLTPTCNVADEYLFPTTDPNDALLGAALGYLATDQCPQSETFATRTSIRSAVLDAPIDHYPDSPMPQGMLVH